LLRRATSLLRLPRMMRPGGRQATRSQRMDADSGRHSSNFPLEGRRRLLRGRPLLAQSRRSCARLLPRSLLSIARLNMVRSRARPLIWNVVQIDQTGLGRSGGFGPVSLPLFQGNRYERRGSIHLILHGHTPRSQRRGACPTGEALLT
jgi:hypothetical protein